MTKVMLAAALPIVVFFVFGTAMSIVTGRQAALVNSEPANPKPLNTRTAYNVDDMEKFFTAIGTNGLNAERRFLEFDLVFPTLYGGALAVSLWWLCRKAGWSLAGPLSAVTVGVVADWIENLIQLELLHRYTQMGRAGLLANLVRVASVATLVKLGAIGIGFLLLLVLTVVVVSRRPVRG